VTTLVADALVERLRDWGIHRIFGFSGDGIDPILAAIHRSGGDPRLVTARHEEAAAFMATAHAKWTGATGCCLATHGPGAIHLLNGLYDAKLDKKPVVAIIAQQHRTALGSGYQQEIDARTLFKDVCGAYLNMVTTAEQLHLVIDRAVRTAQAMRAPTCVIVPHDVQQLEMPDELPHTHLPTLPSTPLPPCSTPVSAWPSSSARARQGRPPRWPRWPTGWVRVWPRPCLARPCSPTSCRSSPVPSGTWAPPPATC
jgi:pyruvate dehydrogenase (quinone)